MLPEEADAATGRTTVATGLPPDLLAQAGIKVFGPSAVAARLEGSKGFTKDLCRKYGIPTGAYERFTDVEAATDYIRIYADQIREFVPMRYTVLGTDGFGRSDTRANLRRHFEVDRFHIAHAAIAALAADGKMTAKDVARAIKQYKIDSEKPNPIGV